MLSEDDIHAMDHINGEIAKAAFEQTRARFEDHLAVKEGVERKATTLFSAYITIVLAFSALAAGLAPARPDTASLILIGSSVCFVFGAIAFVVALRPMEYGYRGEDAASWLVSGRVDAQGDDELARMHLYGALGNERKAACSERSNAKKIRCLRVGMKMGVIGAAAFIAGMIAWVVLAPPPA